MMNGMWSKSSKQFADRLERNTLKIGLGLGASLLSSLSSTPKIPAVPVPYTPNDSLFTPAEQKAMAKSSRITCIVLLILAPIFQALSFVSYVWWGWWPFFALLIFSTIAVLLLGGASVSAEDLQYLDWKIYKRIVIIITIELGIYFIANLWPVFVGEKDISSLAYILMAFQMFFAILLTAYTWREYKERKAYADLKATPVGTPPTTRTSRTTRVKEMEARYDRVKAALDDLVKAEDKLEDLSEDIDALRDYVDSGKWQKDFEADEQGKLPKDLKRGVLSEDGLWNLLEEVEDRI